MQRKEKEMKRASFFKVMIGNFAEKMHIPMQLVHDFGRELGSIGDQAILNGPRRTGWRVQLKMEDGSMFFQRGWRKFIKHHDVEEGYFLVFRYDGQSHFDVEVFDKSACLKKYADADDSCDSSGDPMGILCSQCHKDLLRTKERNNYHALQHTIHRSQTSNAMKRKKSKSENTRKNGFKKKLHSREKNRVTECLSGLETSNFEVSEREDNQETESGKRLKAGKEVVEGESSHPIPKHSHFMAEIKPTNLKKPYMCIPKVFSVENELPIGCTMTLRDPERRSWKVKIVRRSVDNRTFFQSGWIELAVANDLKIGDRCFFEIIPSMKNVMNVQIERK